MVPMSIGQPHSFGVTLVQVDAGILPRSKAASRHVLGAALRGDGVKRQLLSETLDMNQNFG
jgi:hypothetical protein